MESTVRGNGSGFGYNYNQGSEISTKDEGIALASEVFDHFCSATTLKSILGLHRHMCDLLKLRPTNLPYFYPKLKSKLRSWKANALWKRLDIRANHKCYNRGRACPSTRVLVIGAGPCGLRAAIECQLLGAKVVVIEKRDRISRNNVLHLWPFVIQDLRALGAKKFFGKFCAGAIDHISIRQLQCILLKVALLLGVEMHEGVSFESLVPPSEDENEKHGWRAKVSPIDHPVSHYEFDVLIGADGKRNTLDGFKRKEFRGKLAIAITANFINKHSEAEARVQEISGVAFIFNQKFFKDLYQETGIDLENIVYYKDETHYFVMTAKKHSLIDKGVILQDVADTAKLLAPDNVNKEALMNYAREAAEFSTNYQMPNLEFAVNHYGQPDVAMFDFTSMYAAENASRVIERKGYKLLMCLVGDSLLEPFWPTGSGCARGFLSSLDACWAVRAWGSGNVHPLDVIAERESIYRLLGQTTPENLQRDYPAYTLCPSTRYPNLNRFLVTSIQVKYLYDTDNVEKLEIPLVAVSDINTSNTEIHKKKRKRDNQVHPVTLLRWIQRQVAAYSIKIESIEESFKDGLALCAIIHRYRPELIDWSSLNSEDIIVNYQLAFDILEKEMGIPPVTTGAEIAEYSTPDKLTMLSYLSQIYETFHGEIPQTSKHLKIDMNDLIKESSQVKVKTVLTSDRKLYESATPLQPTPRLSGKHQTRLSHLSMTERRRKRRSADKATENREAEIIQNRNERMSRRRQQRKNATEQFYKSIHMLHTNAKIDNDDSSEPFEDYSIYLYRQTAANFEARVKDLEQKLLNPDRDRCSDFRGLSSEENFSGRIKNIEQKLKHRSGLQVDKKPPDLLRAIGKIESSDWNVREIEKKIMESKLGKNKGVLEKEKVPKWSREQFIARQSKLEKKSILERTDSVEEKYTEIDKSLKTLEKKLKEGSVLETGPRGNNKVASMAEQFNVKSVITEEVNLPPKHGGTRPVLNLPLKGGSEMCHFCGTRVYLMEKLSAEGRFFHRGCFRCQYCSINLRLGFYVFDAQHGNKFYCPQHAGMQGKTRNIERSLSFSKKTDDTLDAQVPSTKDGQTPERIEFANLVASGHISENEELPSQMDEDEWTDRNFGQSTAEVDSSDISDSDSDDLYEEALERAGEARLKTSNNLKTGENLGESPNSDNCDSSEDDESSYYDYSSDGDGNDSVTDEEEIKVAREIRRKEFNLQERLASADTDTTGSDTEVASDEETESSEESRDSATEISTDSEFKLDGTTPTVDIPPIMLNDAFITKTRGNYATAKRIEMKENQNTKHNTKQNKKQKGGEHDDIHLHIKPIVPDIAILAPKALNTNKNCYFLNRTHSTEGIASKVSLELKKQYLLGTANASNNIQKSGSASMLDSKLKSFHSNISEHQKLLNPSLSVSPPIQSIIGGSTASSVKLGATTSSPTPTTKDDNMSTSIDKCKHICCLNVQKSDSENDANLSSKLAHSTNDSSNAKLSNHSNVKSSQTDDTTILTVKPQSHSDDKNDMQETSLIVPNIPWNTRDSTPSSSTSSTSSSSSFDVEVDTDSLSSFDAENHSSGKQQYQELSYSSSTANNITVPKLQINGDSDGPEEMAMDSLLIVEEPRKDISDSSNDKPIDDKPNNLELIKDYNTVSNQKLADSNNKCIKIKNEPKYLNQPKQFEPNSIRTMFNIENLAELKLHRAASDISISSSSSTQDKTGGIFTETELSDWAHDENVSDDLEDVELKIDADYDNSRKLKEPKFKNKLVMSAVNSHFINLKNLDSIGHVCGKEIEQKSETKESSTVDHMNDFTDLDSIEFMDTVSEENPMEAVSVTNMAMLKNQCYVQFVNVNHHDLQFPSTFVSNKPPDGNKNKFKLPEKQSVRKTDQLPPQSSRRNSFGKRKEIDEKLNTVKNTQENSNRNVPSEIRDTKDCNKKIDNSNAAVTAAINENSTEYLEHITRLQNKITEFSNVRDSIDIRKSKAKNKSSPSKTSENSRESNHNRDEDMHQSLTTSEKLKEIINERTKQKNLIHEMVMDKLKMERKLPSNRKSKISEKKENLQIKEFNKDDYVNSHETNQLYSLQKSLTDSALSKNNCSYSTFTRKSLSPTKYSNIKHDCNKLNSQIKKNNSETTEDTQWNCDRTKRHSVIFENDLIKKKPSFQRSSSINEHLMFTIKNTSITPDSSINTRYSSDVTTESSKKPNRTKSFSEISKDARVLVGIQKSTSGNVLTDLVRRNRDGNSSHFKSEPCLVERKIDKKIVGEKRRSIIQAVTDFFYKRKESDVIKPSRSISSPADSLHKDKFSLFRISPKSKDKTKSKSLSIQKGISSKETLESEVTSRSRSLSEEISPPIPPLPSLEFITNPKQTLGSHFTSIPLDDSQTECTRSTDTLDFSKHETYSLDDLDQKKFIRRSQHKRLRIAQEIQRKLEETEVKTRDLESRGVELEKILRGESTSSTSTSSTNQKIDESVLLAEWLTLMRELAALRRYERELLAKAEDLRLEEKHSILQTKLRTSLESSKSLNEPTDDTIVDQILDISEKRESLALMLEKNNQRYIKEDTDLEALMLAKGLQLTSVKKSPAK